MINAPAPSMANQESPRTLPEFWPPADPIEPVKAWRIHWLLAFPATLIAMLVPRRLGPHLAASSWVCAYVAHVLAALLTLGIPIAIGMEDMSAGMEDLRLEVLVNPLVEVRKALAAVVLFLYAVLTGWEEVGLAALVTAAIEGAIWAAAVVLIPLLAAGEGARRTYLRCVKLLLWSSACQLPIVWLFMRLLVRLELYRYETWPYVLLLLLQLWWLSVLVRLGGRYAGPKQGPRWQERQPRCEACGYSLVSLSAEGRCPECGEPVVSSLPEHREPPAFATARGLRQRFVGFFVTTWRTLFARRFATQIAVWSHHRAARNYAALVCVLIGLVVMGTSLGAAHEPYPEHLAVGLLAGIGAGLGTLTWLLLVGLFVSRFGFRDMADRVVMLCYATAWLLVPLLLGTGGAWAAYGIVERWGPFGGLYIREIGTIDYDVAVWLACLLPCAVTFLMSFLRVRVLLRYTRFANA